MQNNEESIGLTEQQMRMRAKLSRELGPTISEALQDPLVNEIMLNPDGLLWKDRLGAGITQIGQMDSTRARSLIGTIANLLNLEVSAEAPIVEGELPFDGSRFAGAIEPLALAPVFSIRKHANMVYTFADYIRDRIITLEQYQVIDEHIRARHNILVVGATKSGKTTLCNAILQRIAEVDPDTRIAILEDTRELQCNVRNKFSLRSSDTVDLTALLRLCMRMRPDRIVVGEVRDKAALALIKAWNTGHPGGVSTVHANSALAGLIRLEQLVQEANVPPNRSVIAEAVDCIVSIQMTNQGRRIEQIATVHGADEAGYKLEII